MEKGDGRGKENADGQSDGEEETARWWEQKGRVRVWWRKEQVAVRGDTWWHDVVKRACVCVCVCVCDMHVWLELK